MCVGDDRAFTPQLFQEILRPHITHYLQHNNELTAVTKFGLQVDSVTDFARLKSTDRTLFLYSNVAFNVVDGWDSADKLENNGFFIDKFIYSTVTKNKFHLGGLPELTIVRNTAREPERRQRKLKLYLGMTAEFHKHNAACVMWAQGATWASLSFMDWVSLDKSFPIIYLLTNLGGVGKTTTLIALAASVGLPESAVNGNKSSESGVLDWVSTHNGLPFFFDDINAKASNMHQSDNTWKEIIKQVYDAKTVTQHDKVRCV